MLRIIHISICFLIASNSYCQKNSQDSLNTNAAIQELTTTKVDMAILNSSQGIIKYETHNRVSIFISASDFLNSLQFVCAPGYGSISRKVARIRSGDTIFLDDKKGKYEFIINTLLQEGKTNLYLNIETTSVPFVIYKLEAYDGFSIGFYYLPDGTPFFPVFRSVNFSGLGTSLSGEALELINAKIIHARL